MDQQQKSALATFHQHQWPIGTPDEAAAAGYDVKHTPTCAEPVRDRVRGCPLWEDCRCNLKGMGGFKGESGPRYIGYRLIRTGENTAAEDVATCYRWTLTLQKPADAAFAERRATGGKRGDIIRVIAQEGDTIKPRYYVPTNGKGQVVNVMPELVPILEANDIDYSQLPNEVIVGWKYIEVKRTVPRHPRPGEITGDTYAQRVAMRDVENENFDQQHVESAASPVEDDEDERVTAATTKRSRNPWGRAGKPKEGPSAVPEA